MTAIAHRMEDVCNFSWISGHNWPKRSPETLVYMLTSSTRAEKNKQFHFFLVSSFKFVLHSWAKTLQNHTVDSSSALKRKTCENKNLWTSPAEHQRSIFLINSFNTPDCSAAAAQVAARRGGRLPCSPCGTVDPPARWGHRAPAGSGGGSDALGCYRSRRRCLWTWTWAWRQHNTLGRCIDFVAQTDGSLTWKICVFWRGIVNTFTFLHVHHTFILSRAFQFVESQIQNKDWSPRF